MKWPFMLPIAPMQPTRLYSLALPLPLPSVSHPIYFSRGGYAIGDGGLATTEYEHGAHRRPCLYTRVVRHSIWSLVGTRDTRRRCSRTGGTRRTNRGGFAQFVLIRFNAPRIRVDWPMPAVQVVPGRRCERVLDDAAPSFAKIHPPRPSRRAHQGGAA